MNNTASKTKSSPAKSPYLVSDRAYRQVISKATRRSKIARAAAARRKARKKGTEVPPESDTAPAGDTTDSNSDVRDLLQHTGYVIEDEGHIIYTPGYYEIPRHLDRGRT